MFAIFVPTTFTTHIQHTNHSQIHFWKIVTCWNTSFVRCYVWYLAWRWSRRKSQTLLRIEGDAFLSPPRKRLVTAPKKNLDQSPEMDKSPLLYVGHTFVRVLNFMRALFGRHLFTTDIQHTTYHLFDSNVMLFFEIVTNVCYYVGYLS